MANPIYPPTVALNSPADLATGLSTTPTLEFTGTDPNGDDVRYNVQVHTNNTFGLPAISIDATASTDTTSTLSLTVANNSNRLLIVTFGTHQGGAPSGITYNGDAMTLLKEQEGSYNELVQIWGLVAPDVGTANIVVSGASNYRGITAYSLYGCDQTLPDVVAGASSDSNTSSLSITPTVDGCLIIDSLESEPVPTMTTSGGTNTAIQQGSSSYQNLASSRFAQTTAGAKTMSYSMSYGARWNLCAVAVEPYNGSPLLDKTSETPTPGFANTVTPADPDPFNSGEQVSYTVQGADELAEGTYYWRVRGKDPSGSDTFGDWSATRQFTVEVSDDVTDTHTVDVLVREDTDAPTVVNSTTYTTDSYTNNHTISAFDCSGTDPLLLVFGYNRNPLSETDGVAGITANSVAMTLEQSSVNANVASVQGYSHLINNSSFNIVCSIPSYEQQVMIALALNNVDQTTPVVDNAVAGGYGTTASASYTGTAGNLLVVAVAKQNNGTLTASNCTETEQLNGGDTIGGSFVGVVEATGASQTVGATWTGADNWRVLVLEIAASAEDVSVTQTHTVDALAREAQTSTHALDTFVRATDTTTHTADVLARTENTSTHTVDTLARAVNTDTHTVDTVARVEGVRYHTTDTIVRDSVEVSHSVDTRAHEQEIITHTVDTFVLATGVATHTIDVLVFDPACHPPFNPRSGVFGRIPRPFSVMNVFVKKRCA